MKIIRVKKGQCVQNLVNTKGHIKNLPIVTRIKNRIFSLDYPVPENCEAELLYYYDAPAFEVYRKSTTFVLVRAVLELYRNARLVIGHSIGNTYYYDLYIDVPVSEKILQKISERMKEIAQKDEPFIRKVVKKEKAIEFFNNRGYPDKVLLLQYFDNDEVVLYSCGNYTDISYGPLVPSTGYIQNFELKPYNTGFVLVFPEPTNPDILSPVKEHRKLFHIYKESKQWGKILEVNNIGRLNEMVVSGKISNLIKVAEALHEKKIAAISDLIYKERQRLRLILIAGPSSSGKTTFSKRLAIHLMVNGLRPVALSLDDYFVDREDNPLDEHGNPDFESIHSLDVDLFNDHLVKLIKGKEVWLPKFNFEKGKRELNVKPLRINEDQLLIVEGIHALNEELTHSVSTENKFKIYISALTQLSIDDFNRISTTDTRKIRRIVRDHRFRGYSARETIARWPSVRKGENRNIFPYQEQADVMFNSALAYELGVLKPRALPLLSGITREYPEYDEARRLMKFLAMFKDIPDKDVPPTSILREFIGGSSYKY